MKDIIPKHIKIIDSGEAVARQTKYILEQNQLIQKEPNTALFHHFFINNPPEVMQNLLGNNFQVIQKDF